MWLCASVVAFFFVLKTLEKNLIIKRSVGFLPIDLFTLNK